MGRRSKAELLQVVDRIVELHAGGKSNKEIAKLLQGDGYEISHEAVRRTVKASKEVAEQFLKVRNEMGSLIEVTQSKSNTELLEASTSLLSVHILNYIKALQDIEVADTGEVVEMLRKISQAQVQLGKLRLTYQNGVSAAKDALRAAVSLELTGHPELIGQINSIIDKVSVDERKK